MPSGTKWQHNNFVYIFSKEPENEKPASKKTWTASTSTELFKFSKPVRIRSTKVRRRDVRSGAPYNGT